LRLHDDAADEGYTNDTLQIPLYEAYSSIFDIITRERPHPIVQLFHTHMARERTKFHKANRNRNLTPSDLLRAASSFPFSVPILPGDASLTVDFMASLLHHVGEQLIGECAIECIAQALFNLVILRTYLGRTPENDLDIFEAVKDGQISRIWTSHEQALAACHGEESTGPGDVFDATPSPELWGVRVVRDTTLGLVEDHPFVALKKPIVWTSRPGLSGGALKPRRYRPPSQQLLKPGPRPKPRPAYSKNGDNSSTDTNATALVGIKRPSNMMVDVEVPVAKKTSAEKLAPNQESAVSVGVRRGTRPRKAVRY